MINYEELESRRGSFTKQVQTPADGEDISVADRIAKAKAIFAAEDTSKNRRRSNGAALNFS